MGLHLIFFIHSVLVRARYDASMSAKLAMGHIRTCHDI